MHVNVDQARGNNQSVRIDDLRLAFVRLPSAITPSTIIKIGDFIAPVGRIDDAAVGE